MSRAIMKTKQWSSRCIIAVMVVAAALLAVDKTMSSAQAAATKIFGVNDNAYGNTYGEWSARWWQWLLSIPAATNPNLDTTGANCTEQQSSPVFFLAGTFGGPDPVIRKCTVHAGAAVFDCDPTAAPAVTCNLADLRTKAADGQDSTALTAIIDGKPVKDLNQQRVQSPVLTITYPDHSVTGVAAGAYAPNVSDGYWLLLAPLSMGKHSIYFKAGDFLEVTYNLTVQ